MLMLHQLGDSMLYNDAVGSTDAFLFNLDQDIGLFLVNY